MKQPDPPGKRKAKPATYRGHCDVPGCSWQFESKQPALILELFGNHFAKAHAEESGAVTITAAPAVAVEANPGAKDLTISWPPTNEVQLLQLQMNESIAAAPPSMIASRLRRVRTGMLIVAMAVLVGYALQSAAGEPPYSGNGHLSASGDWKAFFIASAVYLLPVLALLGACVRSVQSALRAWTQSDTEQPSTAWQAVRMARRATPMLIAALVVGAILGSFGAFSNVACPTVQNNSSDAICVAGTAALVGDLLAGLVGGLIVLWLSRGVSRELTTQAYHRALPGIDDQLLRLVIGYAKQRRSLTLERREQLAATAAPALRQAEPDAVERGGPLAALDRLADRIA